MKGDGAAGAALDVLHLTAVVARPQLVHAQTVRRQVLPIPYVHINMHISQMSFSNISLKAYTDDEAS